MSIMVLMWAGNNVTRPFRVAGSAAAAPLVQKGADWIQKRFGLKNQAGGFAVMVILAGGAALTAAGLLVGSRLVMA